MKQSSGRSSGEQTTVNLGHTGNSLHSRISLLDVGGCYVVRIFMGRIEFPSMTSMKLNSQNETFPSKHDKLAAFRAS